MRQIISPHIDDAFLSMGGCISNWLNNGEKVKIIYIFTKSSWTSTKPISNIKYPANIKTITALRKAEESNLQNFAGHNVHYLDWYESGHRGKKSMIVNFLRHGSMPISQNKMIRKIEGQLLEILDKDVTTYFPLAMGEWIHPDHAITKLLGLSLLKKGFNIAVYEDLPYCSHINTEEINSNFANNVIFMPVYEEIDMERKINLLEHYQSQMSREWLQTVRDYGLSLGNGTPNERYWITG